MERRPLTDIVLGHIDMDPIFNLPMVCTCVLRLQLEVKDEIHMVLHVEG
jgi:hypothetical protein